MGFPFGGTLAGVDRGVSVPWSPCGGTPGARPPRDTMPGAPATGGAHLARGALSAMRGPTRRSSGNHKYAMFTRVPVRLPPVSFRGPPCKVCPFAKGSSEMRSAAEHNAAAACRAQSGGGADRAAKGVSQVRRSPASPVPFPGSRMSRRFSQGRAERIRPGEAPRRCCVRDHRGESASDVRGRAWIAGGLVRDARERIRPGAKRAPGGACCRSRARDRR